MPTFRWRISWIVESTGDHALGPWLAQPVQVGAPVDDGDGKEAVTFRDIFPIGGTSARFLRLRVSVP